MRQRRALGDAGGAAGVLQEGDVVEPDRDRLRRRFPPFGEHGLERDRGRQVVWLHRLLHVARDEVHDRALETHEVARRDDHDLVEAQLRQRLLDRVAEILEHEEDAGAGIAQLMDELARRVERVDVDDRVAGGEDAVQDRRIGHHVRQHDRDAVAACCRPCACSQDATASAAVAELGVAHALAEALDRRALRIACARCRGTASASVTSAASSIVAGTPGG